MALACAGWLRFMGGVDEEGQPIVLSDPNAALLKEQATEAMAARSSRVFLEATLGADASSPHFVQAVDGHLSRLLDEGARAVLAGL